MSVNLPTGALEDALATEIGKYTVGEVLLFTGAVLGIFLVGRWLLRKVFGTNAVHVQTMASRAKYASVFPMAA